MSGLVRTFWSQITVKDARAAALQFLVFAAYFLTGKLGLSLAYINPSASPVWAPAGIALAAFLIIGPQCWPAIALGAFLVNVTTAGSVVTSLAIAVGNTFEAALGAYLINRYAAGREAFRSSSSVFRFTAITALCSTPVSATIGVMAISIAGFAAWKHFATVWMTWWLGDLAGILVVTPLIILWSTGPFRRRWTEVAEAAALLLLLVPTGLLVFGDLLGSRDKQYPLEFMCVPLFLWAAFRLGRREAVTAVGVLSVIAVWGSHRGYGPFVQSSPNESFLLLQSYTAMWAVVSVAIAAVVSEHRQSAELSRALAITDPLTGLANFRRLSEVLTGEIARSSRTGRPFALLFLDLNGLKKINDRYGHLAGNQALRRVADALRKSCRTTDTPARFGGDEFVAILPETDEAGGQVVARRVAERVATDLTAKPPLSISTGIAVYPRDGMTPAMLLAAADSVLYQVKVARPGPRRRVVGGR